MALEAAGLIMGTAGTRCSQPLGGCAERRLFLSQYYHAVTLRCCSSEARYIGKLLMGWSWGGGRTVSSVFVTLSGQLIKCM